MATPTPTTVPFPNLGVNLADVTSFADTTLIGFGVILAAAIGLGLALRAIKAFVRR